MRCTEFRKVMQRVGDDDVPLWLRHVWEKHLGDCSECLDYYMASIEPDTGAEELTRSILLATSLDPCVPFQDSMCHQLDGELDADARESLSRHLGQCSGCRELAEHMPLVATGLKGLERASPPQTIVAGVLEQTSARTEPGHSLRARIQGLFMRPRFSLEASFITTLLWVCVFGLPNNVGTGAVAQESIARSAQVVEAFQTAEQNLQSSWRKIIPVMNNTVTGIENLGLHSIEYARETSAKLTLNIEILLSGQQ